jgi:hypothetical protein
VDDECRWESRSEFRDGGVVTGERARFSTTGGGGGGGGGGAGTFLGILRRLLMGTVAVVLLFGGADGSGEGSRLIVTFNGDLAVDAVVVGGGASTTGLDVCSTLIALF